MTLEIFETVEQGSAEWHELRRGLATASEFGAVMAKSSDLRMRRGYMRRLACERITGQVESGYRNAHIDRGHKDEGSGRAAYCTITGNDVRRIGFARDLDLGAGCSTDGLVDDDGLIEIKCPSGPVMVDELFSSGDGFPSEHYWQCMGAVWLLRRQWCDLVQYHPSFRVSIKRLWRAADKCVELAREIATFNAELADMVAKVTT